MNALGNARIVRNPKPVLGRTHAEPKQRSIVSRIRTRVAWWRFAYYRNKVQARKGN